MTDDHSVALKALRDKAPRELLEVRVLADDETHVTIRLGSVHDPGVWGLVFADLARHVANIYHIEKGADRKATVESMAAAFNADISSPADRQV